MQTERMLTLESELCGRGDRSTAIRADCRRPDSGGLKRDLALGAMERMRRQADMRERDDRRTDREHHQSGRAGRAERPPRPDAPRSKRT
jgi:hypothetical protein